MTLKRLTKTVLPLLALLLVSLSSAAAVVKPDTLVGEDFYHLVQPGDTLIELARQHGIGYGTLINANPTIDPWQPPADSEILIPRAAIVPYQAQPGITINLAEQRLYLIREGRQQTLTSVFPIGIGREGRDTPTGNNRIVTMIVNPSWTAPPSWRTEHPQLPAVIPPGPDNPLGDYWIGLSQKHIGLHGTNRPYGIGRQVSSGCIRLYPEHIQLLFERTHIGMAVTIIDQPIKLGHKEGQLYLEAHPDPADRVPAPIEEILRQRDLIAPKADIDWQQVRHTLL
ncbi:MAG: L,D-transpeptidase family protein, partial [Pelovirga sp.]